MTSGHYISISATGIGPTLWATGQGTWTDVEADRHVFLQVFATDHMSISGLPEGYRTRINFELITLPAD